MPNRINNRLASRLTHLQIERVLRAETVADSVAKVVEDIVAQVLRITSSRRPYTKKTEAIVRDFNKLPDKLKKTAAFGFKRLGQWSHREAVGVYAATIPRKWIRKVNPAVLLVGEAVGPIELPTKDNGEPVVPRMTDEEWSEFLKTKVFHPPSEERVEEIIHSTVEGQTWEGRIERLSKLVDPEVTANALAKGFAEGKNVAELAKDVLPHVTGKVRSSAQRIARTEGLRVANEMQRESYKDLGPLMVGIQVLASLDENTRPHHALRNGRIYFNDGRQPDISELPVLPDEANCRCFDSPVLQEPENLERDPDLAAELTNASGDSIPDPLEYAEWFDEADEGRRKLAVGKRRYDEVKKKLKDEDREPR